MKIRRLTLLGALCAALSLTACAGSRDGSPAGSPSPSATPTPAFTVPSGSAVPSAPVTGVPSPAPSDGLTTLTGQVSEGVEAGCLILRAGSTSYLLLAPEGDQRLRAGATVTVRGRLQPDLVSTCQQGTPFVVTEVQPG